MAQQQQVKPSVLIGERLYFPISDAATYINASEHSLRREVYMRKVKYMDHTQGLMFLPEWLDKWLEDRTKEPIRKKR